MKLKNLLFTCLSLLLLASAAKSQTVQSYVEEHTDHAQELMREYDVPASVILAVAIHESAAGTSKIARNLNNHFGIKGSNSNTAINSSYRDYGNANESYDGFVEVLQNHATFNKLFSNCDQYDYAAWTKGIQRGGYASSRKWANQVLAIIHKYELYQYDERPDDYIEPAAPEFHRSERRHSRHHSSRHSRSSRHHKASVRTYLVKKGDNLNKLAQAHGTSAKVLMQKNGLKRSALKPGQKIRF